MSTARRKVGDVAREGDSESLDDAEVERRFAALAAHLGQPDAHGTFRDDFEEDPNLPDTPYTRSARGLSDTDRSDPVPDPEAPSDKPAPKEPAPRPTPEVSPGPRDYEVPTYGDANPDEGIDGFRPPDPGSANITDMRILGGLALVGIPIIVFFVVMISGAGLSTFYLAAMVVSMVVGVGLLVSRLPAGGDDDSPGGDGAVV